MRGTSTHDLEQTDAPHWPIISASARVIWLPIRVLILVVLTLLEPIVCGLLWVASIVGIAGALFYRLIVHDARFPFWPTIGLSLGLALLTAAYCGIIRLLGGTQE